MQVRNRITKLGRPFHVRDTHIGSLLYARRAVAYTYHTLGLEHLDRSQLDWQYQQE